VTNENAPAVAELCVQLDGLPLAIELAAARVKLLPPQALLARLGQRLELLRGGARDRPERQQTLRATLDWSFDLLGEPERRLFARLSVFAGGFRLEQAEAVCDADLDAVEALLEINLLRSEERPDGEPRFFMLETIRDYAREQLERDGSDALRERHAFWFADWLERRMNERASGRLIGNWDPEDEEHDNIRAALEWTRGTADVDLELRLAASVGRFYWPNRGFLTEGRHWLDEALSRSEGADERWRALAMLAAAHHAWRQGEPEHCDELAAGAQLVFERLDDAASLASALMARAIAAEARGDLEAESAFYDTAERIFRDLGHTDALDAIVVNRAYAEIIVGNFAPAERRLRELASLAPAESRHFALVNHGLALARLGRLGAADARFAEALETAALSSQAVEVRFYALEGLGSIAGKRGDDLRAARLWGASAGIREATGSALATAEQRFHDEVAPEVRNRLGDAEFDRAWNEGRQLPRERAIELALREP